MPEPGKSEPWWSGVSRCALLRPECEAFPFLGVRDLVPVVFAGLEGGGLKCTRGGARGDRPLSGRRCRFTVSYLLCLLFSAWLRPVRHSWCTVYFEHFVDVSNHLTCLSALDLLIGPCWTALHVVGVSLFCEAGSAVSGLVTRQLWWPWVACLAAAWEAFGFVHCILDGATRGRCLIVLWGRGALCQRAGFRYTAVVVAVGCMPGCGLGGIWICTLYSWLCVSSMYGHWYWRAVVRVRHFGFRGPVSLGAWSTWRGPWAAGTGRSGEWMPAVLMFTYGNLMLVRHRSAVLCLLLTLLGFVLTLHWTGNDFINLTGNSDFVLVNISEELSRSRAACRGWVTRECKNLATTLEDPELNVVKLSAAMDEFDKRLTNLDDVQSRYELSLEDEDSMLNDITTAADFRDSARKVRTLAAEKFKELSGDSNNKSAAHVSSFSMTDVKLPKLNLPVFNGDVLQWQSFWDQFVAAVDSTDLPDVSKFSYLRTSLEGEPKAAIQGLSLTSAHYASACKILKDRFGRKETIIFTHIQKLLNLSVPSKCSVSALWKLNDDLQAHTRSLATLGIDGDKYGVILTLILSRVPQELRLEWSRDGKGHESDLKFLLSFLEKEIQRRERSQMFQESLGPSFKSSVEERRPRVATASALQATSTVKPSKTCCFCGKNHPTEKCFKLSGSIQVEKEKVKSAGLCFGVCCLDILQRGAVLCVENVMAATMKSYVVHRRWGPLPQASVMCHRRCRRLVVMWMRLPHIRRQQHLSSVLQILHHLVTCPRHTRPLRCSLLVSQCMAVRVLPRPR